MRVSDLLEPEKRQQIWQRVCQALEKKREQVSGRIGRRLFDYGANPPPCLISECRRVVLLCAENTPAETLVFSWLLRELRKVNPSLSLEVLTCEPLAALFLEQWPVEHVHQYSQLGYPKLARLARKLGPVELLIHFSAVLKPRDLFFLKQLRPEHVASPDQVSSCVDLRLGAQGEGGHVAEQLALLLNQCGVATVDNSYWLPRDPAAVQVVQECTPARYRHIIAFNPYGEGPGCRLSEASICRVLSLVRARGSEYGVCLLHSSADEREEVERIVERFRGQGVFFHAGGHSIAELIAQVERADGVISVDAASVPIAVGLAKPLLGLYNPDLAHYLHWGPNNPLAISLFATATSRFDINSLNWQQVDDALSLFLARCCPPDPQ